MSCCDSRCSSSSDRLRRLSSVHLDSTIDPELRAIDFEGLARVANQVERSEDAVQYMIDAATRRFEANSDVAFKKQDRVLFAKALKEFVNPQRAALRTLTLLFVNNTNTRSPDNHQEVTLEYTKCKIDSLVNTCLHIISVVKDTFLPLADCAESRVFFNKLAGDHSRYLCEIPTLKGYKYVPFEKERARAIADTEAFYQVAFDESQCDLSPTHPLRLSLVLNFSIFYFEIRKDKDKAHAFAKSAYDDAMAELGADFSSLLQDPSGGEQSNEASHSGNDGEGGLGASQVLSSGGSQELETARVMRIIKSSLSRWAV